MSRNANWGGQDTGLSIVGALLAVAIGWGASTLIDHPAWLSVAVEVVVTLGLCLALGFWLRSRAIARGVAREDAAVRQ